MYIVNYDTFISKLLTDQILLDAGPVVEIVPLVHYNTHTVYVFKRLPTKLKLQILFLKFHFAFSTFLETHCILFVSAEAAGPQAEIVTLVYYDTHTHKLISVQQQTIPWLI